MAGRPPSFPVDPAVVVSLPRWAVPVSVAMAWSSAVAKFALFAGIGVTIQHAATSTPIRGGLIAWLVAAALCAVSLSIGSTVLSQWLSARCEASLRHTIVSHLFSLGVPTIGRSTGQILSMLTTAVEKTAGYRAGFLGPILGNVTTPLVTLLLIAVFVDPVTAGIITALFILVPLIIGVFRKLTKPVGAAYRRSQAQLTASFLESIQALPMLIYATAADRAADDLETRGEQHRRTIMRLLASNQLLIFVVDASFYLTVVCAATGVTAWRLHSEAINLGGAVTILLSTVLIVGPIDVIGMFFYVAIAGRASQAGISRFLASQRQGPAIQPGSAERVGQPGGVEFVGVTVGWPGNDPVVRGFDLTVCPGQSVCLTGRSGIGKSTLAAAMQAYLAPDTGTVIVDGYDVATTDPAVIRRSLSVIEQRTFLFTGTIGDNVRAAQTGATDEEVWTALEQAGLADEVRAMPKGLDTEVGEHGALLSGGQAQRVSIARAFLRDAPIVILDEPTSQVDIAAEKAILTALRRLSQGRTIIMIAHRPGAIGAADVTIRLSDFA